MDERLGWLNDLLAARRGRDTARAIAADADRRLREQGRAFFDRVVIEVGAIVTTYNALTRPHIDVRRITDVHVEVKVNEAARISKWTLMFVDPKPPSLPGIGCEYTWLDEFKNTHTEAKHGVRFTLVDDVLVPEGPDHPADAAAALLRPWLEKI